MSENPGGTPPRDDEDPSVPPPPPAYGQPGDGTAAPPPPAAGGGAYPPPPGYGTPPASPYGQPGAYPPPAAGGYPPAAGGYPPPGGGYQQGGPSVDIGAGFSWAFAKFGQNWVTFVVGTLVWLIGIFLVVLIVGLVFGGIGALSDGSGGNGLLALTAGGFLGIVVNAAGVLVGALFAAAAISTALKITAGRAVTLSDMFQIPNVPQVLLLGLLVAVAEAVVSWVPVLGWLASIAITYFVFFSYHLVVDRGLGAIDAIRESVALQTRNVGSSVLVLLVVWACVFVGLLACGIGVLVGLPVALLVSAYAYRRVTGGQIAA